MVDFVNRVRVEIEISIVWAAENPELFKKTYQEFFDSHSTDHEIRSKVRRGYITLIAERKIPTQSK